jgi:hypothetical protein
MNYVVVLATCKVLLEFYIFKGERLWDGYIKKCKSRIYMVMQKKTWMTIFLFKEFKGFFKRIVTRLGGNRLRSLNPK